jgi:hypothetical protein
VKPLGEQQHVTVFDMLADRPGDLMHLAPVGEQGERASAGHLGEAFEAVGLTRGQSPGLEGRVGIVLDDERGLAPIVEGRGEDALVDADVDREPGLLPEVLEAAGDREGRTGEHGRPETLPKRVMHEARGGDGRSRE